MNFFPKNKKKSSLKTKGLKLGERQGFQPFLYLKGAGCIDPYEIYSRRLIFDNKRHPDYLESISLRRFSQKYYFQLRNGQGLLCYAYPFFS